MSIGQLVSWQLLNVGGSSLWTVPSLGQQAWDEGSWAPEEVAQPLGGLTALQRTRVLLPTSMSSISQPPLTPSKGSAPLFQPPWVLLHIHSYVWVAYDHKDILRDINNILTKVAQCGSLEVSQETALLCRLCFKLLPGLSLIMDYNFQDEINPPLVLGMMLISTTESDVERK